MESLCVNKQPRLTLDRAINCNYVPLVKCCLCHGLVVDPVGCANCDGITCSVCIHDFHSTQSEPKCPYGCTTYIKCSCPKPNSIVLDTLKITCQYKANGCNAVLPYKDYTSHEIDCDYQLRICPGCEQDTIKKDFEQHYDQCPYVSIVCDQCSSIFQRKDTDSHIVAVCLRVQLHQQNSQIKELIMKESEQQTKMDLMEEKLQKNEVFWLKFYNITTQVRNMLDGQERMLQVSNENN
ncbi:unnamed protein product [Adineta ricciae]|uniref:SIAH-type domain-containing protein n=1 Tax=Adineta ricciae TaxID=249248 RepID=A0A813XE48_ADIRI|nr:unnamed protein product [Adineta ricciae]